MPEAADGDRRALLVVNPHSNRGSELRAEAERLLAGAGLAVSTHAADSPEAMREAIRAHAGTVSRVVLAGGDGTVHAALPALIDTGLPFALLPTGTANDLARTLGIPAELEQACAVAAGRRAIRMDAGRVDGVPFVNVAHIGLGVHVTRELSGDIKRRFGVLGYAHALWRAVSRRRSFAIRLDVDGREEHSRCMHVGIGNARYYGGGMAVDEEASPEDGLLALFWVRPRPLGRYLAEALKIRQGRHRELEFSERRTARRVGVRTSRPMPVTADGELVARTPVVFETLAGALRVLAPASRE